MALPLHQRTKLLKKWDLSCPKCGAINNVRIAGVYDFANRPHRWFCHCGVCGETFNPRPKGGDTMASIMGVARKALPKDKLGLLLAAGKTNKEIGIENGKLPHWAVSALKKEYWPDGFPAEEYKQQKDKAIQYPERKTANESTTGLYKPEEEKVIWAIPYKRHKKVQLSITRTDVRLTIQAVEQLNKPEYVKVGVKGNHLIVASCDDQDDYGFRLSPKSSKGDKGGGHTIFRIGGKKLLDFLSYRGFPQGRYELEVNDKGWLISKLEYDL